MIAIVPIANFLIDLLYMIVNGLLFILPNTPFNFEPLNWGSFGSAITLFLPIPTMMVHLTGILSAVLLYYGIRWLLRLIKMIQ